MSWGHKGGQQVGDRLTARISSGQIVTQSKSPTCRQGAGRETFRTNLLFELCDDRADLRQPRTKSTLTATMEAGNQISSTSLGGSSTETVFDITPSVRYAITQHCSVNVGYRYTDVKPRIGYNRIRPASICRFLYPQPLLCRNNPFLLEGQLVDQESDHPSFPVSNKDPPR